jgi:hypothetical protein
VTSPAFGTGSDTGALLLLDVLGVLDVLDVHPDASSDTAASTATAATEPAGRTRPASFAMKFSFIRLRAPGASDGDPPGRGVSVDRVDLARILRARTESPCARREPELPHGGQRLVDTTFADRRPHVVMASGSPDFRPAAVPRTG